MKIVTIVGARPQFIKAAMVSQAIQKHNRHNSTHIEELILHTGQHYDKNMSAVFFDEMKIPSPDWQLHCRDGSHGEMTGNMLIGIEKILKEAIPDYVLVYGDTNSTLAGALAASKLHIPVIHVEAGLRSFNKQMPEEVNRILTDHVSSILCCPTYTAVHNLEKEGIRSGVHHVGDVMYDAALSFGQLADSSSDILVGLGIKRKSFLLATVHREENTNNRERLREIMEAIKTIATPASPVVFPLHPRTKKRLEQFDFLSGLKNHPGIRLVQPLPFLDMIMLEKHASFILTDSGGVQKEAYFHRTPCITLREETEWEETIGAGWNQLAGYQLSNILQCINTIPAEKKEIPEFGKGDAAEIIVRLL